MTVDDRRPLAHRSAIILAYADGERLSETIRRLNASEYVVLYWRKRFKKFGTVGLLTKMGRPKAQILLTAEDRRTLVTWLRGEGTGAAATLPPAQREVLARRAAIILASAADEPNKVVAKRTGVEPRIVKKWRDRFLRFGTSGLLNGGDAAYALRDGAAVSPSVRDRIRELALNKELSTYEIARAVGVSQMTVSRTLRNARKSAPADAAFPPRRR
jgi:transposase-like protein